MCTFVFIWKPLRRMWLQVIYIWPFHSNHSRDWVHLSLYQVFRILLHLTSCAFQPWSAILLIKKRNSIHNFNRSWGRLMVVQNLYTFCYALDKNLTWNDIIKNKLRIKLCFPCNVLYHWMKFHVCICSTYRVLYGTRELDRQTGKTARQTDWWTDGRRRRN